MGAERGADEREGWRIEENREERGQKRKEGGIMNAFCVKAALSVVGRAPGRLRAGLKGGRGPRKGQQAENRSAQRLIWSRLVIVCTGDGSWMVRGGGDGRCECGESEVSDGMTVRPTERETEGEEAERGREALMSCGEENLKFVFLMPQSQACAAATAIINEDAAPRCCIVPSWQ